jgi:hypothetical protein
MAASDNSLPKEINDETNWPVGMGFGRDTERLSGGEGKVLGTLIGAFIIAVIQNGMNLTGVKSYQQKVVLGLVILGAVLLDRLKMRGWGLRRPHRA